MTKLHDLLLIFCILPKASSSHGTSTQNEATEVNVEHAGILFYRVLLPR